MVSKLERIMTNTYKECLNCVLIIFKEVNSVYDVYNLIYILRNPFENMYELKMDS